MSERLKGLGDLSVTLPVGHLDTVTMPVRTTWRARYARRAGIMGKLFFLVTLPYAPLFTYWGVYWLAALTAVINVAYLSPLWFIRKGYDTAARVSAPLVATVLIGIVSLTFGRSTDVHLALFVMLGWSFQLFDVRKEWKALGFVLSVPVVLFTAVQLWALPQLPGPELSQSATRWLSMAFGISTMVAFTVTLAYFYARNQDNEKSLEKSVVDLVAAAEEKAKDQAELRIAHDRAQEALAAKSELLAMVSHELCGPLHGIMGSLGELRAQPLQPESQELVQLLQDSGHHLASLLQGLIDFVNIDAQNLAQSNEAIDIAEVASRVVQRLAPGAYDKELELDLRLVIEEERLLLTDAKRVDQLIAHLVKNAIQYTHAGWVQVSIEVRALEGDKACVKIDVEDSGPGIAPEMLDKLFAPFEQAADIAHRGTEGLGLGLAICRKIAVALGGSVEASNRPAGGARLEATLQLPLAGVSTTRLRCLEGRRVFVQLGDEREEECLRATLLSCGAEFTHKSKTAEFLFLDRSSASEGGPPSRAPWLVTAQPCPDTPRHVPRPITPLMLKALLTATDSAITSSSSSPSGRQPVVLIAEDNKISLRLISRMMNRFGYRVVATKNGREAVNAWRRESFDLALLDVQMPELDGLDVAREIRSTEPEPGRASRRVPIVIVTANVSLEQRAEARSIGVDAYLNKPCPPEELGETLRSLQLPVHEVARPVPVAVAASDSKG